MAATLEAPPIQTASPNNPFGPADVAIHEQDKIRRANERRGKQPTLRKALDPSQAAQFESAKPLLRYRIKATWHRADEKGHLNEIEKTETVSAHNENDAWAKFCDKVKDWPSRNACDHTIKQLDK